MSTITVRSVVMERQQDQSGPKSKAEISLLWKETTETHKLRT
jgi:hypothetical protein